MIPSMYHSLRREGIKNAAHSHPYGVRSIRPTWFEDSKIPSQLDRGDPRSFQPMHGLKLVIKEDVMPQEQMPHFPALEKLAAKGFLAVETWNNKQAMLNFKASIEVPGHTRGITYAARVAVINRRRGEAILCAQTSYYSIIFFSVLRLCGSRQVVAHCCKQKKKKNELLFKNWITY